MGNNKKLIFLIVGVAMFAMMLVSAYFGYEFLSSKYKNVNSATDNLVDNENIDEDSNNNKVLAKDFVVYGDNLKEVKLSDYRGIAVIINYWASWCPPCKDEMPAFNEMSAKYSEDQVVILMINATDGQRETMSTAKQYIDKNNFKMNVFYDSKMDLGTKYKISSIPRTFFIDKDGYIVDDHTGSMSKEQLETKIKALIGD